MPVLDQASCQNDRWMCQKLIKCPWPCQTGNLRLVWDVCCYCQTEKVTSLTFSLIMWLPGTNHTKSGPIVELVPRFGFDPVNCSDDKKRHLKGHVILASQGLSTRCHCHGVLRPWLARMSHVRSTPICKLNRLSAGLDVTIVYTVSYGWLYQVIKV